MQGADFYAGLFKSGQHGRLYFQVGEHARGKTFQIYVLPEGEEANAPYSMNPPLNPDAVEVYGITGGQPGWTETYGWLHRGPWVDDFNLLVAARVAELKVEEERKEAEKTAATRQSQEREKELLKSYAS